ncbi:uncharacterized protein UV8b_02488 [Ustilaginoidea virens]|uniref:mRNA splicing factor RNA helicase n=1 Tax=Ustilaginoidea virens TaxID=1159556 RepID=A0A8E5MG64_USTVR|nr:uncharacterized protein UV8b_02488 [Ustilaginoidea virens]QUC18247.1 hypothetical protein UV8b_02488 [Ustilaginoidea virens]
MDPAPLPVVKFRPAKRRRVFRQSNRDYGADVEHSTTGTSAPEPISSISSSTATATASATASASAPAPVAEPGTEPQPEDSLVPAAVRLRNARKARLRGVGFSTDSRSHHHTTTPELELALVRDECKNAAANGIPDRFTYQTGLISTLNDKHMNEYIESRLSSRAEPRSSCTRAGPSPDAPSSGTTSFGRPMGVQPTRQGRLVEVDVSSDPLQDGDPTKRRTGMTSQPAPRRRNRRGSDDIKRDQLVDAFLHENKLDVNKVPVRQPLRQPIRQPVRQPRQHQSATGSTRDGRSADDRMAEEFRQRYMDEMAARRQRRRPIPMTRQQKQLQQQRAKDVLKGPKLGGSRNERAAVRNILLQQEKEKAGMRF